MLCGSTAYGEIAIAEIPDPNARRQGAIVATLNTVTKYQATVETQSKIQVTVSTQPGR